MTFHFSMSGTILSNMWKQSTLFPPALDLFEPCVGVDASCRWIFEPKSA